MKSMLIILILCIIPLVLATSDPAEFGDATKTTCMIGGTVGNLNCTNNITSENGYFIGDGSKLSGLAAASGIWGADNFSTAYNTRTGRWSSLNASSWYNVNGWGLTNFTSASSAYIQNTNTSWVTSNQNVYGNCSIDQSCDNVIYTTDKLGNTSLEIQGVCWANVTSSAWITPSHVLDIDDEDIESDLNTYVDIAGDTMTGSLLLGGYLDANGQNIGSTSDEIENVYVGVNTKIYLGDGQEGEVYFDGSKLIIKVS